MASTVFRNPASLEEMALKKIVQPQWQRKEVEMFLCGFRRMIWVEINEKNLQSRRAAGWEAVNNAILTRAALSKRRDMGWELILDNFRDIGMEENEDFDSWVASIDQMLIDDMFNEQMQLYNLDWYSAREAVFEELRYNFENSYLPSFCSRRGCGAKPHVT